MKLYEVHIVIEVEDDKEARSTLCELCNALSYDNDDYEFRTHITEVATGQQVSIYDDDYPKEMRQSPDR